MGPRGVCTIEAKYWKGLVYADKDDSWRRDKHDQHGNLETGELLRDGGDRSPSRQVREVATGLERFLHHRMRDRQLRVRTAVILTHERSRLGDINATVDMVCILDGLSLDDLVPAPGDELTHDEVDWIRALIKRDHRFHEEKRNARLSQARPPSAVRRTESPGEAAA